MIPLHQIPAILDREKNMCRRLGRRNLLNFCLACPRSSCDSSSPGCQARQATNERAREVYRRNAEKKRAMSRDYYARNRESKLETNRAYRQECADVLREYRREYHDKHRERRNAYMREWKRRKRAELKAGTQ